MRAAPFAIVTALLPFLCIHLCYLVAASHGHVPWCNPYWESCTSISATGRELPEKLFFKFFMIPAGIMSMLFWWLVAAWLFRIARRRSRAMPVLGSVAGVFLVLYVVALGEGRDYQTLRKVGIVLFFSLTYLAQLVFLWHCSRVEQQLIVNFHSTLRVQKSLAMVLLAIGLGSVLLDMFYAHYGRIEDAFEWVMMLFVVGQFGSHYWLWRRANLRLEINCVRD